MLTLARALGCVLIVILFAVLAMGMFIIGQLMWKTILENHEDIKLIEKEMEKDQ